MRVTTLGAAASADRSGYDPQVSLARAARRVALAGRQLGLGAAGCALAAACVTDHDALAKRDWDATGGGGSGCCFLRLNVLAIGAP